MEDKKTFKFVVKVLKAVDAGNTVYHAFYLGEKDMLVTRISNAKEFNDFDEAMEKSKTYSADCKKTTREWSPTFVAHKLVRNKGNVIEESEEVLDEKPND